MDKMKKLYQDLVKYLQSVKAELKRVTWPSSHELRASTIVVLLSLVIASVFIGATDNVFGKIFTQVYEFLAKHH